MPVPQIIIFMFISTSFVLLAVILYYSLDYFKGYSIYFPLLTYFEKYYTMSYRVQQSYNNAFPFLSSKFYTAANNILWVHVL